MVKFLLGILFWVFQTLLGGFFCQFPVTALLAAGFMGRRAHYRFGLLWHKLYAKENPAASIPALPQPGWLLASQFRMKIQADWQKNHWRFPFFLAWRLIEGAWKNLQTGLAQIFACFFLIAWATLLMQLGWKFGWHNSFNKGFEDYLFGVLLSLAGILAFLIMAPLVLLGQVHQSVQGRFASAFDIGFLRRLLNQRPVAKITLALVFLSAFFPIAILNSAPRFFELANPAWAELTDQEFQKKVQPYFYIYGLVLFLAVSWVRNHAVKLYAKSLWVMVKKGDLDEKNRSLLAEQGFSIPLLKVELIAPKSLVAIAQSVIVKTTKGTLWSIAIFSPLLWLAAIFLVYFKEFINYHPETGFLNHPFLLLPWIGPSPF